MTTILQLATHPLVYSNGHFDTKAVAARVNELFVNGAIWENVVERVWREASAAQAAWLIDNVKPIWTPSERLEYAALWAQQNSLPHGYDRDFREFTWALQKIATDARDRAFNAALPMVYRTREAAMDDVRMPGDEFKVAAE